MKSRIQTLESLEDDGADEGELAGSLAVRMAAREQRYGLRHLDSQVHYDTEPRFAWLSLNPKTGEPRLYNKAAAERLERAFRDVRGSVPLAGLGHEVDGCIVKFGVEDEGDRMVETTEKGRRRDVQRVEVPGNMRDFNIYVTHDEGRWRLVPEKEALRQRAADAEDGEESAVELRKVVLSGFEVVAPPRKLPPVNTNQRTYFLNPYVDDYLS